MQINFMRGEKTLLKGLKMKYFHFIMIENMKNEWEEEKKEEKQEETITDVNELNKWVIKQETGINNELFKEYFKIQRPSDMFKYLHQINAKEKNSKIVNMINSGLEDLVNKILKFNKQNQEWKGIKILTPNQMLSRLPVSLAKLEAENNCNKLKNEIRQLLCSLYRSKNMTKQIYNNLLKPISIKYIIIVYNIFIIIIIVIIIVIIVVTIKGIHYKKWRQFLWILKIVKQMNHRDLD